jgi:hypothetical protein
MPFDPENLPKEAQELLKEHMRAREAEYSDSLGKWRKTTDKAYDDLAEALPTAKRSIVDLAQGAESESVRLKASIFIFDKVLGRDAVLDPHDPLAELVNKLRNKEQVFE